MTVACSTPLYFTAVFLSDMHVYNPVAMAWMDLSSPRSGDPPSARFGHGFTSAGGLLYVHGGVSQYLGTRK